jgi:hypothetical protein
VRLSAKASLARANALSRTNSLTERLEAAAAACKVCFALRVSLKSSFSLRVERGDIASPYAFRLAECARQCQDRHKLF